MVNKAWARTRILGTTSTDLNGIPVAELTDKDFGYVRDGNYSFEYRFNSASTLTEDPPYVVKPNDAGATGRWIMQQPFGTNSDNLLINSEFRVNQDVYNYTSSVAAGSYFFDGWFNKNGNDSHAVAKSGIGIVPGSGGSGDKNGIAQLFGLRKVGGSIISGIEQGDTLTATLDWDSGAGDVRLYTGYGSSSSSALTLSLAGVFTPGFSTVTFTANYNSVDENYLAIELIGLAPCYAIKIERGATGSTIQRWPFERHLRECLHYYQKSYNYAVAPGSTGLSGAVKFHNWDPDTARNGLGNIPAKVSRMAKTPTATLYSTNTGAAGYVYDLTGTTDRAVSAIPDLGENGFSAISLGTAMPATNQGYFHYVLNARP